MADKLANVLGCQTCGAKYGIPHRRDCTDWSAFKDQHAYYRGWQDARYDDLDECREESPAYKAGFHNGVVAREEE